MNNNYKDYNRHQKAHEDGILNCPECHLQFSPFERNRPKDCLVNHMKSHKNENSSFMHGSTKVEKQFKFNEISSKNGLKCQF